MGVSFLIRNGYHIIARNYRNIFGEIDIIGRQRDTLCFIEVKTRRSLRFGSPAEAVSKFKQLQISRTALGFLKDHGLFGTKARFDVLSIVASEEPPRIELIKNAFELDNRFIC